MFSRITRTDYFVNFLRVSLALLLLISLVFLPAAAFAATATGQTATEQTDAEQTETGQAETGQADTEQDADADADADHIIEPKQSTNNNTAFPAPVFDKGSTRLAGADRFATSIEISKRFTPGVDAVYLANGFGFADAVSGVAPASLSGGPVLLTAGKSLDSALRAELQRLKPKQIILLGGTGVISKQLQDQAAKIAETKRFGGSDRYDTSLLIATGNYNKADTIFIASGHDFPDALSAAGPAGVENAPIILLNGTKSSIPGATLSQLKKFKPHKVVIVGGTGVISTGIEKQLKELAPTVTRYGGADRFETSAALNNAYFATNSDPSTAYFASGLNFPDALSGGALAGYAKSPLYITNHAHCLPENIHAAVSAYDPASKVLIGGPTIVSNHIGSLLSCENIVTGSVMKPNKQVLPGSAMFSSNKKHSVTLSNSGSITVKNHGRDRAIIETGVKDGQLTLDSDRGLIVSNGSEIKVVAAASKAKEVVLGDDGNLVIKANDGKVVWSLSSAHPKRINRQKAKTSTQDDSRWGHIVFGHANMAGTGCVPAAMATALGMYGIEQTALQVAHVMRNKGDFNHGIVGSGPKSIVAAAKHYGVMARPLDSKAKVDQALKDGHVVLAAQKGPSTVVNFGIHMVALSGFDNGKTFLQNPKKDSPDHWISTQTLWDQQSDDPIDHPGMTYWAIG